MIINAENIVPFEKIPAIQLLAAHGFNPESKKVKRLAEYLEAWRKASIEASQDDTNRLA